MAWCRYEAMEIDGRWFVSDNKHPESAPVEYENEDASKLDSRMESPKSADTALTFRTRYSPDLLATSVAFQRELDVQTGPGIATNLVLSRPL